jgi:benzoyl-CoA-dihydrodiol lyase
MGRIDFATTPEDYRHWTVEIDNEPVGAVATVTLRTDPAGGMSKDYELKLNSYDLSVDIELYDIAQRLRFEHPEVGAVVITGGLDKVFCAGANIQMLAGASHADKVNFCKFTNETRLGLEDASATSRQVWVAALNGTAAGGGYELALACEEIILVDDRSSTISLPEVPLLGVLPGTGGLTRMVDKRHVRRDRADVFATRAEGLRGEQALSWGLIDSVAPPSIFSSHVVERATALAAGTDRPGGPGVSLHQLDRILEADRICYPHLTIEIDRDISAAHLHLRGPGPDQPASADGLVAAGAASWILAACRELDDAVLHLRFNEPEIGTWVLHTNGSIDTVLAVDDTLERHAGHWLVREIRAFWKRTFKRIDTSSRTVLTLVEPGSCFAGSLAELVLIADRSFMLYGDAESDSSSARNGGVEAPALVITEVNDGSYPMGNGLSRLSTRFLGHETELAAARECFGKALLADECEALGLITFAVDDIDWDDEVRLSMEERAAFSPDALTGLEANLRFAGPETMETKIFARLSAWQNWIFLRPNASGPEGALRRYGTGSRPSYDPKRV